MGQPQREQRFPSRRNSLSSGPVPQLLPTLPQTATGRGAIKTWGGGRCWGEGKGKGMQCAASRPGGSATHAPESRYWVSAPSLLQCPERQETWDEDPDRRSRMPSPRCLLLPQALRRGPGCLFWETCRGWEPGLGTSGLQGRESRLARGKMEKWECREPEQTGQGRKEGWGQEAK